MNGNGGLRVEIVTASAYAAGQLDFASIHPYLHRFQNASLDRSDRSRDQKTEAGLLPFPLRVSCVFRFDSLHRVT